MDSLDISFQLSGASTARGRAHSARGPALMTGYTRGPKKTRPNIDRLNIDMIGERFWKDNPEILEPLKTKS